MSCERAGGLLHGYLDGELDAAGALEFERHLRGCSVCAAELDAQQSLRARLRDAGLYAAAPDSLSVRMRERLEPRTGTSGKNHGERSGHVGWRSLDQV